MPPENVMQWLFGVPPSLGFRGQVDGEERWIGERRLLTWKLYTGGTHLTRSCSIPERTEASYVDNKAFRKKHSLLGSKARSLPVLSLKTSRSDLGQSQQVMSHKNKGWDFMLALHSG